MLTAAVATAWIAARSDGRYPLGVEPIFPALAVSAAVWLGDVALRRTPGAGRQP